MSLNRVFSRFCCCPVSPTFNWSPKRQKPIKKRLTRSSGGARSSRSWPRQKLADADSEGELSLRYANGDGVPHDFVC